VGPSLTPEALMATARDKGGVGSITLRLIFSIYTTNNRWDKMLTRQT